MEILTLTKDSIKIKGKISSFVVDPIVALRTKTQADAVIILTKQQNYETSKIEGGRVIIQSPGEYEVGGVKITGFRVNNDLNYNILIDGIDLLLTSSSSLAKQKEPTRDYHVLVLEADAVIDDSVIATFSPQMVVLYGEKSGELFASLGTTKKTKSSKITLKKEQLPEELEVVLLE